MNGKPEASKVLSNLNSSPASLPATYFNILLPVGGNSLPFISLPTLYFIAASLSGYAATDLMEPKQNDGVKPPGKKNLLKITT